MSGDKPLVDLIAPNLEIKFGDNLNLRMSAKDILNLMDGKDKLDTMFKAVKPTMQKS